MSGATGVVFIDGGAPNGLPAAPSVSVSDLVILAQGGIPGVPGSATDRTATVAQIFEGTTIGPFLPIEGGTLLGPLTLAVDPTQPLDAVTKRYTDAKISGSLNYTATGGIVSRPAQDRAADVTHVRDFGAVFDGASHPLSAYYPTLAAAQAVYPHAVALTDEIDGVAIQAAINFCQARVTNYSYGGEVRLPVGLGLINRPLVINKSAISLRAAGGGFLFRSNVQWWIPTTATTLRWTGAARTPGQGQINMLTVEPLVADGRMLAAMNITGILFDCNLIAGCAGPVFRTVRESTIDVATNEPLGIGYPGAILTAGSTTIALPTTAGIRIGESIVSASLPEGAYVANVVDGTTIATSIQASATSTETVTIGGEGIRFDVVPTIADSNDCRELTVRFHGMSQLGTVNACAPLFMIGGSGPLGSGPGNAHYGNTCVATFYVWVCNGFGPGIVINNSDHNLFPDVVVFHIGAGTGSAIVCNGSLDPNNGGGRFHRFGHIIGGGAIKFTGTDTGGFTSASTGNVIDFLDRQNAGAYPTVGAGASIRLTADNYTPGLAALGSAYGIVAHIPDSTVLGGNNRGANAVDLQQVRTAAIQVATGQQSTIGGGENNTISAAGTDATIVGGFGNLATGIGSAVLGGVNNSTSQNYAVASGVNAAADLYGCATHSGGTISPGRRAQKTLQILRGSSAANTTPVRLTADGLAAGASNVVNLMSASAHECCALTVLLSATDATTAANSFTWSQPLGLLKRSGPAATTTYTAIGAPVSGGVGTTAGIAVAETADTVNAGYNLTFTPPTGNTSIWRVVATVEWTRVDGA